MNKVSMTKIKILAIITAAVLVTGLVAFIPPEQVEAKKGDLIKDKLVATPGGAPPTIPRHRWCRAPHRR